MQTFLERLRELAVPAVYLGVATANQRAIRFYERVGFERIKVYDTAIAFGMRLRVDGGEV
jgi:ribosomal protein S18 acetylase RimI-like enzyme